MQLAIDRLLNDRQLRRPLAGRRVALLGHPASVTADLQHSLDMLATCPDIDLTCAFGPQHGMRGELQDNMQESPDYTDPTLGLPVFSLYGEVRRPTDAMLDCFDVLLVDLQDIGCRIYTYLTTLAYLLEDCARAGKRLWVLDRPNPAGRPIDGSTLEAGWESFVGCGPLPMRHGLTLGEAAQWLAAHLRVDLDLTIIEMNGYDIDGPPGHGWPLGELSWVNPSPNAASPSMARCFGGTVLLEGTTLSEGRGTTRPLELIGAPDIDFDRVLATMRSLHEPWLAGCRLRPLHYLPTFHKHVGRSCHGFQLHVDDAAYRHDSFKPYRIMALALKAIRTLHPDYPIWRDFHYEYERDRLAIDLINGGPGLREWVDDAGATPGDLEQRLAADARAWAEIRQPHLIYR